MRLRQRLLRDVLRVLTVAQHAVGDPERQARAPQRREWFGAGGRQLAGALPPEIVGRDEYAPPLFTRSLAPSEEAARRTFEAAEAALAQADSGEYGRCVKCGGPIGAERLEALPGVAMCVTCQAAG